MSSKCAIVRILQIYGRTLDKNYEECFSLSRNWNKLKQVGDLMALKKEQ